MKAYIFPGQGSQKIGMGKEFSDNFLIAKDVFAEVDDALGQHLSKIMFSGEEEDLTLTENAQPAIMANSIAILRVLQTEIGLNFAEAKFTAGHSLGEYSALTAADAISLADTARLLKIRGKAMQKAVPLGQGTMAAIIGLSIEKIEELCVTAGDVCDIANDNSNGQIVISGDKDIVINALKIAKDLGAKRAIELSVSAPFHCSLMQPAAKIMAEALEKVEIRSPIIPLIANISANAINNVEKIRKSLISQVTGKVRWRESVEYMFAKGVKEIIEIGEGKILSGLNRRINKEIKSSSIGEIAAIKELQNV